MIAKSLYYKQHIGDTKRKKISTILYAASSIGNQINMNDSFLCLMFGQVVKRNCILLFQNLTIKCIHRKCKKTPFVRTDKKTIVLLKKKLGKGHRPTIGYEMGIETSGRPFKSTSSLTNQEIQNRYVNLNNIQGKYFVNDLFSVYEINIYEILIY